MGKDRDGRAARWGGRVNVEEGQQDEGRKGTKVKKRNDEEKSASYRSGRSNV